MKFSRLIADEYSFTCLILFLFLLATTVFLISIKERLWLTVAAAETLFIGYILWVIVQEDD
jgi:hypothetical protein